MILFMDVKIKKNMRNKKIYIVLWLVWLSCISLTHAQKNPIVLTLNRAIEVASDSSLDAFRYKNLYQAYYWQHIAYKANRLPSLTLNTNPVQFYRDITKRYDYDQNIDVYREQQTISSSMNLAIKQNFDLTGGTFFIDSELGYMYNFGDNKYSQFNTIPVRIGYEQSLIGYNAFRWEKKIEPLKYERAKKELIYNLEATSEKTTNYFFELAMCQAEFDLAKKNLVTTDTLYRIGVERHKIAAISQADLLTLELDKINAQNTFQNAEIALRRAMFSLASFLGYDKNSQLKLVIPGKPTAVDLSVEKALQLARENNPKFLQMKESQLEAERDVDKARKESMFNARVNASIGLNQVADNFSKAYRDLLQQEIVGVNISIPLVDWGVRKGRHNMAKNNLNVLKISNKQEELQLEEDLIMTVGDFNIQQKMIQSAENALDIATLAYDATKRRFLIGKADVSSLTLAQKREQEAQQNYIRSLKNYWVSFFKIRKLTLFDFETGISLSRNFDYKIGLE